MFNPKKTIPKLAVATLALTGCGSDGSGNGGAGGMGGAGGTGGMGGTGPDFAASLSAFCMNVAPDCIPDYSAQDCINYYTQLNEYNANANCTAALISYFDCGASKTCNQILVDGACDDEYYAAFDVCNEIPQQ
ncbi:MAG: hypothetical protein WCE62_19770 [Polyangiales bacterium]